MTVAPGTPTEVCAYVTGPLEIWLGTGASSALEFLGRTVNGVSIEEHPFITPIHSDENGGDQGPPVDYQIFGSQHRISLEMVKFSASVLAKLEKFYSLVGITGTAVVGSLISCQTATMRVLICSQDTTTFVRNYPNCFMLDPIDLSPLGSQVTRARVNFTHNAKTGVQPWNTTIV